jgi:hypothetical protein
MYNTSPTMMYNSYEQDLGQMMYTADGLTQIPQMSLGGQQVNYSNVDTSQRDAYTGAAFYNVQSYPAGALASPMGSPCGSPMQCASPQDSSQGSSLTPLHKSCIDFGLSHTPEAGLMATLMPEGMDKEELIAQLQAAAQICYED